MAIEMRTGRVLLSFVCSVCIGKRDEEVGERQICIKKERKKGSFPDKEE